MAHQRRVESVVLRFFFSVWLLTVLYVTYRGPLRYMYTVLSATPSKVYVRENREVRQVEFQPDGAERRDQYTYDDMKHGELGVNPVTTLALSPDSTLEPRPCEVDVVYLWVNGSDPERVEERRQYEKEAVLEHSGTIRRFREWNELSFSLKLLRKHARNIRHVYIVTAGEQPAGIADRVRYIRHSDFIPTEYLPTFSSHAILFNLWRIKELSEPFIQMDDDFFITSPIDMCAYVHRKVRNRESWGREWGSAPQSSNQFVRAIQNTNYVLGITPQNVMCHIPTIVTKKVVMRIHDMYPEAYADTMQRFRGTGALQFQYAIAALEGADHDIITEPCLNVHFIMMNKLSDVKRRFSQVVAKPRQFLCLNDDIDRPTVEHREAIKSLLETLVMA